MRHTRRITAGLGRTAVPRVAGLRLTASRGQPVASRPPRRIAPPTPPIATPGWPSSARRMLSRGWSARISRSAGGHSERRPVCEPGSAAWALSGSGRRSWLIAALRSIRSPPRSPGTDQRTLLPEWVPRPEEGGLLDTFFSWSRRLSLDGLKTLAAGAFLVAAALLASSIRWRQPVLRSLALIPLAAWLVFLGVLAFRWSAEDERVAVVVLPEVVARSADSRRAAAPAAAFARWLNCRSKRARMGGSASTMAATPGCRNRRSAWSPTTVSRRGAARRD